MADNCARTEFGALRKDITDFSGDQKSFTMKFKKSDGTYIDISADLFFFYVEKNKDEALFELEIGDGILLVDDYTVQVTIDSTHTALLPKGIPRAYWLRWIRPGTVPETPLFGNLIFARNPASVS